jgi:hypothetical protein
MVELRVRLFRKVETYIQRRSKLLRGKMQSKQNLTHNVYINYAEKTLVW